ncbi:MAG: penicillin-binding transpeptidase domain-containing protein [Planctomycetota bacterium]|nr:penicillin-binding transpeptidase domain-containing protein [Planctomycetota bacterium]
MVLGFVCALLLLFIAQCVNMQLIKAEDYRYQASSRAIRMQYLPAARGMLLDRNGEKLASNEITLDLAVQIDRVRLQGIHLDFYRKRLASLYREKRTLSDDQFMPADTRRKKLLIVDQDIRKYSSIASRLISQSASIKRVAERCAVDADALSKSVFEAFKRVALGWEYPWTSVVVAHDIDPVVAEAFASTSFENYGWTIATSLRRVYTYDEKTFHILGYMRELMASEITALREDGIIPGRIRLNAVDLDYLSRNRYSLLDPMCGAAGVERAFEMKLRGGSGLSKVFRKRNRPDPEILRRPPENGEDVVLSIDSRIQRIAYSEFRKSRHKGAIIVMKPETGEVLAMVSMPSVSPSALSDPVTAQKVFNDKDHPLFNRAIQEHYPTGSVFKIVMSVAGLEEGVIGEYDKVNCEGTLDAGDRFFRCYNKQAHGPTDLRRALKVSCNIFFYKLSEKLSKQQLVGWAEDFGYSKLTGIPLRGETDGNLPNPRDTWFLGERYMFSIGQGAVAATPLQVARMTCAIANGGKLVRPALLRVRHHPSFEKLEISPSTLEAVREGMKSVCMEPGGTAHKSGVKGITAAGKTGSAEVQGKNSHAWFTCFTPYEEPKYVVTVLCENAGTGGSQAAPIAWRVLERIWKLEDRFR